MLCYLMAVIQALCLKVDQKQAAESLGCEREPPASPISAELHQSCGCTTQDLTPGLQQDGRSQQQGCFVCAQHSLHGIVFKARACISHPSLQDTDSRTQPLAHSSLHTACVC